MKGYRMEDLTGVCSDSPLKAGSLVGPLKNYILDSVKGLQE